MSWAIRLARPSPLPGFGTALGVSLLWLGIIVLFPLGALILRATELGPTGIFAIISEPRILAALRLSFGLSFAAAALNIVLGGVVAWVLSRYAFPGRRLLDAAVDLPFALPTAVAGIALTAIYAPNGWIGAPLAEWFGLKVAYTPIGIFIALTFVGLPFIVRTVQPVLAEIDPEIEEASATLGARRFQTIARVVLPPLLPAFIAGFAFAFARAVGEYGSVVFISGNIPFVSEIAPLVIVVRLDEFDFVGATGVAVIMLAVSFIMLFVINALQAWSRRKLGHG